MGGRTPTTGVFAAAGGDRSLVTSYASSPVAEVVLPPSRFEEPPTGVLGDGCFRQVEFAGILNGAENPDGAAELIDFMLSETFQSDIPLNMFVLPARTGVELPEVFVEHSTAVNDAEMLDPAVIEDKRAEWTERWTELVLR